MIESAQFMEIEADQEEVNVETIEPLVPQRLQCSHRSIATTVCLNSNCSSYVFLCGDKTCQCYKQHKGCIKGSIESIHEAIEEKLTLIEPFQKRIDVIIQNAIDDLSNYRDRIILKTKQDLEFIGLTKNQRQFLKALKTKKVDQLTGKEMNEILSSIDNINGFNEKMKRIETRIQQSWNLFNRSLQITFSRVQSLLEIFSGNIKFQFAQSSIIKTQEHKNNMMQFFDRKIDVTNLLYKASENDFETAVFYDKCKDIKNTLIICQTEYGKLIGGFSTSTWKQKHDDSRWGDENAESFVFSLTNGDKFALQQRSYAFRYRTGYGPMFGNTNGTDFFITNRANKQRESGGNINNGYINTKYTRDSKESWERFTGGKQDFRFYVKEWQVWQIKFENM